MKIDRKYLYSLFILGINFHMYGAQPSLSEGGAGKSVLSLPNNYEYCENLLLNSGNVEVPSDKELKQMIGALSNESKSIAISYIESIQKGLPRGTAKCVLSTTETKNVCDSTMTIEAKQSSISMDKFVRKSKRIEEKMLRNVKVLSDKN